MPSDAPKRGPRAKYSKNGCVTCSRSKVKCTEDRPRCQRCTRLDKECTWPEPRIPLRERQRGYGPLKTRLSFTSREIQPATQLALPPSPVSWSTPADPVTDEELWPGTGSPALSTPPLPPLLTLSMPSSSSVTLGQLEQDGLYYYKNVLHYAIGKEFCWSPMAIVLNKASDRGDIMHLLLAWSLFDLAHSRTYPQALQAARNHFKTGTDILLRSLHADHVDHCASIMAFWLLQLSYRAVWNTTACASMTKLSNMMLGYVQRHGLVKRMTGSQDQSDSLLLPPLSRVEQSVLGLFLLFIVYEEVAPEFGIAGGQLSRFILSNRDLSMSVLSSSRSGLEHHFGELYPPEELIDDFERSRPLELNLDANIALQRLNDIRKSGQPSIQELMQLVELIRTTKSQYSSLLKLVQAPCISSSKFMISTLHAAAILNAVLVNALADLVPLTHDQAIMQQFVDANTELRQCVFHWRKLVPATHPWRAQWPVYVAVSWAADDIHADWLLQSLGNSRYVGLLEAQKVDLGSTQNLE